LLKGVSAPSVRVVPAPSFFVGDPFAFGRRALAFAFGGTAEGGLPLACDFAATAFDGDVGTWTVLLEIVCVFPLAPFLQHSHSPSSCIAE
jgi:hypothetical protein